VAIPPAAGFDSPLSALALAALAAFPSYSAILSRARTRLDDSLDVVAAHGLGGTVGAILTGVLAEKAWNGTANGLLFGDVRQFLVQLLAVVVTVVFSGVGTFLLLKVVNVVIPIKVGARDEGLGLDVTQHGEEAYTSGEGAILILPDASRSAVDGVLAAGPVPEGGRA
ncbi:MAG TPA: ammonia channel protein, partial [Thermoanaerobaculia bacterium]|nr:ammonia channel protein [Thermoanaerobaculia bacterium]